MLRFDLNFLSRMINSGAEIKKRTHLTTYYRANKRASLIFRPEYKIAVVNPYQEFTVNCWFKILKEKKKNELFFVVVLKKVPKRPRCCCFVGKTFLSATSIFGPLITVRIVSTKKMHKDPFSFPFTFNWRALPCRIVSFRSFFFYSSLIHFCLHWSVNEAVIWISLSVCAQAARNIYETKKRLTISSISHTHTDILQAYVQLKRANALRVIKAILSIHISICRQKNFARDEFHSWLLSVRRWECVCVILWYFVFFSFSPSFILFIFLLLNRDSDANSYIYE